MASSSNQRGDSVDLCRVHDSAQGVVVMFEGDQVLDEDTRDCLGDLHDPAHHLRLLTESSAYASCHAVVLGPDRVTSHGFACYDRYLNAATATGEALGYDGMTLKASGHLASVLDRMLGSHGMRLSDMSSTAAMSSCSSEAAGAETCELLPLHLIGFSKGAVVLSQVLTEMAHAESLRGSRDASSAIEAVDNSPAAAAQAAADGSVSSAANLPAGVPPASSAAMRLLDSIRSVTYLDAGLNCRGVYPLDVRVVAELGRRNARLPITIHLVGTPRQWGDVRRPWNVQEKDRCKALLQASGVECMERLLFERQTSSLKMHFASIPAWLTSST